MFVSSLALTFKYFNSDICNYTEAAWKDRERYKSNIDVCFLFFLFFVLWYHLHCLQSKAGNKGKMCGEEHRYTSVNS